ncbi:MAG: TolC family protein [Dysgonamonadaceae bacterium]|jgi:hypothetical protein|nr:TolC family protein [Dysgonamonadaceae bacterium]
MKQKHLKRKCYQLVMAFLSIVYTANAQTVLTVEDCIQDAVANYPLTRQYGLIEQAKNYSVSNTVKSYLPQISLNSQATYLSDVTGLSPDLSSLPFDLHIPAMSKDQYRATLDISQQIWDGGITGIQRQLIRKNSTGAEQDKKPAERWRRHSKAAGGCGVAYNSSEKYALCPVLHFVQCNKRHS